MDSSLVLRPWQSTDCRLVYEVANDPSVRVASLDSEPIPYETHEQWFNSALADPTRRCFVIDVDGEAAGYVRVERGEISIALSPAFRGRGLATAAISTACELLGQPVVAHILPGNDRSLRTFHAAGFNPDGWDIVKGRRCHRLSWTPQ